MKPLTIVYRKSFSELEEIIRRGDSRKDDAPEIRDSKRYHNEVSLLVFRT